MLPVLKTKLIENSCPVGIKKTSNWKLPPKDFSYGKKERPDDFGVDISTLNLYLILVTRSWQIHVPSNVSEPPQDFVKINKLAVKVHPFNHYVILSN